MVGDPRDDLLLKAIQKQVDESIQRFAGKTGQRYDEIQSSHVQIQAQITALSERFTKIESRLDEIEGQAGKRFDQIDVKTGVNIEIARMLVANSGADAADVLIPGPGSPRPAEIDRACGADPGEGPVMALLPEYGTHGLEIEPEAGSDPGVVWPAALNAIEEAERGERWRRR